MVNITINEQEGLQTVVLSGDLDNAASSQAERSLAPVFDRTDCDVLIDCTELNYISSSGLRILLNVYKHTRSNGHTSTLKGMAEEVEEVFSLSGFLQLFKVEK
jgi:anti-sigma B factor antagonist